MRDSREPIGDIVVAGEHGEHTRAPKRCCFVDGSNVCMSVGRAHDYGMRQPGQLDVVAKAALARQETENPPCAAPVDRYRLPRRPKRSFAHLAKTHDAQRCGENSHPAAALIVTRTFLMAGSGQVRYVRGAAL
jgi:hypothetical protein